MGMDGVLGIIGVGNMGAALARGVIGFQVFAPDKILAMDTDPEKTAVLAEDLDTCTAPSNAELLAGSDIVVLAVKPQFMAAMLEEIAPHVRPGNLIISIAAGIPTAMIEKANMFLTHFFMKFHAHGTQESGDLRGCMAGSRLGSLSPGIG